MPSSHITIIAEVGSVHDGSFGNAKKLIDLAAACGTDAVKFQTHIAAAETLRDAPMPFYFKGEPRFEHFERTRFSLTMVLIAGAPRAGRGALGAQSASASGDSSRPTPDRTTDRASGLV